MLKPFEEATKAVSSKGSSSTLKIPVVNLLMHFLDTRVDEDVGFQNMKEKCCHLSILNLVAWR